VAGVALVTLGWVWWRTWSPLVARHAAALCVAGVALGDIHLRFTWQAWHLATSTFVFHLAGVALVALGWVWWRVWSPLVAHDAAALCVAEMLAHFIPPIESASLDFDPWEEIARAAGDVGTAKKDRCILCM